VENQRVVLADNDSASRKNLKTQLTRFDHWVVGEAGDGITALKLVRSRQPDLLVTKVFLPGMDGVQVAKIMRQDNLAPVVLIGSSFQQSVLEKARDAGVFAFLQSPVEDSSLLTAVELSAANYREMMRLDGKIKDLERQLETRKLVEKAKGILMETKGLSEAEAFSLMQRQSMNERKGMRTVAEAIIMAHNLIKGV